MCGFCNVWVCVCVDFVMCGNVYVWILFSVGVLVIRGPLFTVLCIVCTVFYFFFYVYYLFCLYWCKDYCHRVKTQLQQVITIIKIKLQSV